MGEIPEGALKSENFSTWEPKKVPILRDDPFVHTLGVDPEWESSKHVFLVIWSELERAIRVFVNLELSKKGRRKAYDTSCFVFNLNGTLMIPLDGTFFERSSLFPL